MGFSHHGVWHVWHAARTAPRKTHLGFLVPPFSQWLPWRGLVLYSPASPPCYIYIYSISGMCKSHHWLNLLFMTNSKVSSTSSNHIYSKLQGQTHPNTQFPYERSSSSSLSFVPKTMRENIAAFLQMFTWLEPSCSLGELFQPTWNNPEWIPGSWTPQHRSLALNCSSLWAWVPHMKRISMDQHWELVEKMGISAISPMLHGLEYSTPFTVPYENGCGIVLGILFFFFFRDFFFFFGWGWFWGCPGSFLGKRRGERQVCAGFSGHLGVVLGLSRLRSGETSGEMQVPSRFGHKKHQKTASKSKLSRSFLFSVCIYLCWCVCVCVFVIEYVVCVFFLLLFWFFIQCTSFLVFAIYLFNV